MFILWLIGVGADTLGSGGVNAISLAFFNPAPLGSTTGCDFTNPNTPCIQPAAGSGDGKTLGWALNIFSQVQLAFVVVFYGRVVDYGIIRRLRRWAIILRLSEMESLLSSLVLEDKAKAVLFGILFSAVLPLLLCILNLSNYRIPTTLIFGWSRLGLGKMRLLW